METIFLLLGSMTFFVFLLVILLLISLTQKPSISEKRPSTKEIMKIKAQIEDSS